MRRRMAIVFAGFVAATGIFATTAVATSLVYFEGYSSVRQEGPNHMLTETSVRSLDSSWACTTAYEYPSKVRAGEPYCTVTVTAHPYCQCTMKIGAASDTSGAFRAREDY
jgi:hypothetical protein